MLNTQYFFRSFILFLSIDVIVSIIYYAKLENNYTKVKCYNTGVTSQENKCCEKINNYQCKKCPNNILDCYSNLENKIPGYCCYQESCNYKICHIDSKDESVCIDKQINNQISKIVCDDCNIMQAYYDLYTLDKIYIDNITINKDCYNNNCIKKFKNKYKEYNIKTCWHHNNDINKIYFENIYKKEVILRSTTMFVFITFFIISITTYKKNYIDYIIIN